MDPRLCILGVGEGIDGGAEVTKVVLRCLFQARKLIAQRWQSVKPPSVKDWVDSYRNNMEGENSFY